MQSETFQLYSVGRGAPNSLGL